MTDQAANHSKTTSTIQRRSPWLAILLGVFSTFFSMLYLGRGRRAFAYAVMYGITFGVGILPGHWVLISWLLYGLLWIIALIDAFRIAKYKGDAFTRPWYSRGLVLTSFILLPFIAVILVRSFLYEPFRIPSGAMEPTLIAGDYIVVNKYVYGLRTPGLFFGSKLPFESVKFVEIGLPQRGDVAVFQYPKDPATAYIKRIVAVPGDTLSYEDKRLFINGEAVPVKLLASNDPDAKPSYDLLEEAFGENTHRILVKRGFSNSSLNNPITVPPEHYFVMGDNRDNSHDSRYWGFVPEDYLIGKAVLIWWHPEKADERFGLSIR